jgi:ABC-type glycerol-3-phosphate transport system permease component
MTAQLGIDRIDRSQSVPRVAHRRRLGRTSWAYTTLAAFIGLVFVAPALWILIGSFRPTDDIFSSLTPLTWNLIIPTRASFDNYVALLTTGGFAHALGVTALVCIGSVLLGLVLSLPAAYLWPLLVVSDSSLQVAPVALAMTFGEHAADYGQNFAGIIMLSLIPAAIVFTIQRVFGQLSLSSGVD